MSIARTLLLKASDSAWLRENGTKAPFVRRAVSRFMPGESFDDMIVAARTMAAEGVTAGVGQRERLAGGVRPNADADLTTGANGCVRAGVDDGVDGHFSVPFLVSVNEVFRTSCNVLAQDCESDCSHSQSCASKC